LTRTSTSTSNHGHGLLPPALRIPSPRLTEHLSAAGGRNSFEVLDVQLVATTGAGAGADPNEPRDRLGAAPPPVITPPDTTFDPHPTGDPTKGYDIDAWITPSGHVVVPVDLNDEFAGHFLLDTGASGLVIDAKVAQRLGLEGFGEVYVSGLGGNTKSQFRRARTIRVGAMTVENPVLMELPVAPIVSPSAETGEIAGILGYDFFRRTTLLLPRHKTRQGGMVGSKARSELVPREYDVEAEMDEEEGEEDGEEEDNDDDNDHHDEDRSTTNTMTATTTTSTTTTTTRGHSREDRASYRTGRGASRAHPSGSWLASSTPVVLRMWDPSLYVAPRHVEKRWQGIRLISNLPHVHVRFVGPDAKEHTALFMLDSGAGSIGIMIHPRAVQEAGLGSVTEQLPNRYVKGLGQNLQVKWYSLPWAELSGRRYMNVDCLLAHDESSGLDMSLYTAGIVCGDLIFRSDVITDYANDRVAFLPPSGRPSGERGYPVLRTIIEDDGNAWWDAPA
jgi:predicted aspartyl protease